MMIYATLFAIALLLTLLFTPLVRHLARRTGVMDLPDGWRKFHPGPIPRLGGLAVVLGFYLSLLVVLTTMGRAAPAGVFDFARGMLAPSLLVLAIGVMDDLWSVKPAVKLAAQLAAGLWVYYVLDIRIHFLANPFGGESMLGVLSLPATLLWIALVTNAFNIVDGMDGLAAGISLIAATCVFIVSLQSHNAEFAFLAAPLAGAVLGFLRYNFNPASIFLGDTGSLFLGFQLAVLSIAGSQKSSTAIAIGAPVMMLAFPLIETLTSMARRFLRGEPIMSPDRGHIHHQLLRLGLTTRRAVLLLYLGSAVFGITSLFVVQTGGAVIGITAIALAAVTWKAIQWLGYTEFMEINSAFKRTFLYQARVIRRNIQIRRLADDLRSVASLDAAAKLIGSVGELLGFSHVTLKCGSLMAASPASMPDVSRHTVMSITLAGKTGDVGELTLARPRWAEPLHAELAFFIDAIASGVPAILERVLGAGEEPRVAMALAPARRRNVTVHPSAVSGRALRPAGVRPAALSVAASNLTGQLLDRSAATIALQPCLRCEEVALARSHSRNLQERIRKLVSRKRLHRCSACGWRGWVFELVHLDKQRDQSTFLPSIPDLTTLDHDLCAQPIRIAL